jgi:hypothetical protein
MPAFETVAVSAAVPVGGTLTNGVAAAGQTLQIRSSDPLPHAMLDGVWAQGVNVNDLRITSPRLHDNLNGIRLRCAKNLPEDLLHGDIFQTLTVQDTLTVAIGNSGVAETDMVALQIYYDQLSGSNGRLAMWEEVIGRVVNLTSNEIAVAAGAAAAWSAGTAFSAGSWAPEPNTDYAVLGYEVTGATPGLAVAIASTDTGNLFYGGPASLDQEFTRDWFKRNAIDTGRPYIPVVSSANNGTILARTIDSAGTAYTVSFLLAQLRT